MNKVILKGRTTKAPETKHRSGEEGTCYATFTLAVEDRNWKISEEGSDTKYHVDYISCYTIGKLAQLVKSYVGKGQELLLSGKWRTSSYEKDGKTIYTQNMFIQELYFCGKKADNPNPSSDSFMNIPDDMDADLPFR